MRRAAARGSCSIRRSSPPTAEDGWRAACRSSADAAGPPSATYGPWWTDCPSARDLDRLMPDPDDGKGGSGERRPLRNDFRSGSTSAACGDNTTILPFVTTIPPASSSMAPTRRSTGPRTGFPASRRACRCCSRERLPPGPDGHPPVRRADLHQRGEVLHGRSTRLRRPRFGIQPTKGMRCAETNRC